jgi:hypothetical protein
MSPILNGFALVFMAWLVEKDYFICKIKEGQVFCTAEMEILR